MSGTAEVPNSEHFEGVPTSQCMDSYFAAPKFQVQPAGRQLKMVDHTRDTATIFEIQDLGLRI